MRIYTEEDKLWNAFENKIKQHRKPKEDKNVKRQKEQALEYRNFSVNDGIAEERFKAWFTQFKKDQLLDLPIEQKAELLAKSIIEMESDHSLSEFREDNNLVKTSTLISYLFEKEDKTLQQQVTSSYQKLAQQKSDLLKSLDSAIYAYQVMEPKGKNRENLENLKTLISRIPASGKDNRDFATEAYNTFKEALNAVFDQWQPKSEKKGVPPPKKTWEAFVTYLNKSHPDENNYARLLAIGLHELKSAIPQSDPEFAAFAAIQFPKTKVKSEPLYSEQRKLDIALGSKGKGISLSHFDNTDIYLANKDKAYSQYVDSLSNKALEICSIYTIAPCCKANTF